MRILAITPSFYPSIGGVETHVRRVSECLSERGHLLTILTHGADPGRQTLGPLRVQTLRRTNALLAWRAARPHIAAADIVHCHDAYSFLHFYVPSCWLPPRRPVFATFHGYESYPIPSEAISRRHFVRSRLLDCLCMGAFICHHYDISCAAVSYGGVDPVPEPPPLPDDPSAVFIGRLAEDTSIMLYLDALAALQTTHRRRLPLTVAGDGPLRSHAEKYAQARGLAAEFLGPVADPTSLLANASFAFVSGYLAIWQALAYRRLVFAVYENPLKRDYLLGFPKVDQVLNVSSDAIHLAEQLNEHITDPSAGDKMRSRGAQLAAEHTWDRVADLYLEMYRAHGFS